MKINRMLCQHDFLSIGVGTHVAKTEISVLEKNGFNHRNHTYAC